MNIQDPADPNFRARIERYASSPIMKDLLQLCIDSVAPGCVVLSVDYRPELGHRAGWFEGGITSMLGQLAAAWSCGTLAPESGILLTLEKSTRFVGPAEGQRLIAKGRTVSNGRSIAFGEASVFAVSQNQEVLCAATSVTCRIQHKS